MSKGEILRFTIQTLTVILDELYSGDEEDEFSSGQKYAFVECLEVLQSCHLPKSYCLDYDIEEKYPI